MLKRNLFNCLQSVSIIVTYIMKGLQCDFEIEHLTYQKLSIHLTICLIFWFWFCLRSWCSVCVPQGQCLCVCGCIWVRMYSSVAIPPSLCVCICSWGAMPVWLASAQYQSLFPYFWSPGNYYFGSTKTLQQLRINSLWIIVSCKCHVVIFCSSVNSSKNALSFWGKNLFFTIV